MNTLFQSAVKRLCLITALTALTATAVSAATYEEMQRLDAAYPPGSVVVCRSDTPGDANGQPRTAMTARGTIISQTKGLTTYDITVTWLPEGSSSSGMMLRYSMSQRSNKNGLYSRIDPASLSASLPGGSPEVEKAILEGFRSRFATGESFAPYSQTEITDFPDYITRNPGEAPVYCHQENLTHG
ncbi:hypothetical protein [Dryocola sp. BD626]|uniref:hypothetical protein n=1 Tax=Dryocola sp. BD626 TaxID=3133273 RepID=UPI003F508625